MATCEECNTEIEGRRFMSCTTCKKFFHLPCANVSSPRFYLMSPSRKQTWKCNHCWDHMQHNEEDLHIETPNFVTERKYKINIPTCNSFDSLSDDESTDVSTNTAKLNRSCPEVQLNGREQAEELKEENYKLKLELESADEEIKNLLSENKSLKNRITKLESLNRVLTRVCSSTKKVSSSKIQRNSLKKRVLDFSFKDNSITEHTENERKDRSLNTSNTTKKIETETKDDSIKLKNQDTRKLCIISSNSRNKILQFTRGKIEHSEICHYITPGAGAKQLLSGIENKLLNFNFDDYCIIFIGEADFKETNNYSDLIADIRNTLLNVQHTNIILCLPAYKFAKTLYNKRVETFSNLLYEDNSYCEYVYLLDSNKNLEYSSRMFTARGGFVNNLGYKVIAENLNELIGEITHYFDLHETLSKGCDNTVTNHANLTCSDQNKTFFRK